MCVWVGPYTQAARLRYAGEFLTGFLLFFFVKPCPQFVVGPFPLSSFALLQTRHALMACLCMGMRVRAVWANRTVYKKNRTGG